MFCLECGGEIKYCSDTCQHCGFDNGAYMNNAGETGRRKRKKRAMSSLSEEECLVYGIHPNDELYRKTMELNVVAKKYK